jgi:branched-chain amino acid transport system substrate-binding protein
MKMDETNMKQPKDNGPEIAALSRRALLGSTAGLPLLVRPGRARAQTSGQPVKIGVLCDMSGPYSDDTGSGLVAAVRMGVQAAGERILGQPVTVVAADDQNKPDVGVAIARRWLDDEGVSAIVEASASSITLAVGALMQARNKIMLVCGSLSTDITGKNCAPTTFQFGLDTYAGPKSVVGPAIQNGLTTWFILNVDYAFGHSLREETTRLIAAAGGKLLGNTSFPLGTADFSSVLLQAQTSGAKALALACGGTDWSNLVKQAHEFGLAANGQSLVALATGINEIQAVGADVCQGMLASMPFYWDQDAGSREFDAKFRPMHEGIYPNWQQSDGYSSVLHYLKAVQSAGTVDGTAVAEAMHKTPVNDLIIKEASIRADGQVMRPIYLLRVKPESARGRADIFDLVSTIRPGDGWRPTADSACSLLRKA